MTLFDLVLKSSNCIFAFRMCNISYQYLSPTPSNSQSSFPSYLPAPDHSKPFLSSLLINSQNSKSRKCSHPIPWLSDVLRLVKQGEIKWRKTRYGSHIVPQSLIQILIQEILEASAQDACKINNIFSSLLNQPAASSPSFLSLLPFFDVKFDPYLDS